MSKKYNIATIAQVVWPMWQCVMAVDQLARRRRNALNAFLQPALVPLAELGIEHVLDCLGCGTGALDCQTRPV
jgi:hypothetical protein